MTYKETQFLRVTWPFPHPVLWDGPCCGIRVPLPSSLPSWHPLSGL